MQKGLFDIGPLRMLHNRKSAAAILMSLLFLSSSPARAQLNTNHMMNVARNALYYDDYVLSIKYFNMIISAKPYLYDPWFYRGLAKFYLEDYSGCEHDCTEAISRNPFFPNTYDLRGMSRISQQKFTAAAEDYAKAVEMMPDGKSLWHNLVLCKLQTDSLHEADSICNIMIKKWPNYADGYCMKASIKMEEKDSTGAEACIDDALKADKYNVNALTMKGGILLNRGEYADAEKMYDESLRLNPKNAGALINRALCRYNQNNYRGAMKDYDMALEFEPHNFTGHYNRGLLLANVGENNKAIEDFNFIISVDPDDMMAIFNRGELLMLTGNYKEAIRDYTTVIKAYPKFLYGYQKRAVAKRKIGDVRGAERDEEHVLKEEIAHRYGYSTPTSRQKNKTRKKSERNIDDYDKLVVDDEENDKKYESEYRGKVQNHNVEATLIKTATSYISQHDDQYTDSAMICFNEANRLADAGNVQDAISVLGKALALNPTFAEAYYNRGLLKLLIDDNQSAITDLSKAGELGIYSAYNIIKKNQNRKK